MNDETFKLNELKSLILSKLEVRAVTPGDCKRISIEISKTLNKTISETTIKRFFGFALAKYNFSRFTLTTLYEYVDKVYPVEPAYPEPSRITETSTSRADLHATSSRITDYTLKGIRNRSGLPYEMTIRRKFAENDFQEFFKSTYRFTCFIAQPGYGKTTLLSHLVENSFYGENPTHKDSSILFTNIHSLITEDRSFNLEEKLKEQLGIPAKESFVHYVNQYYHKNDEKFIVILDGFDEIVLKRDLKDQLFDSIINLICALEDSYTIKIVMSMRSTTWTRFYERMRHSAYLKSVWFHGNYFNLNGLSNVPPLTTIEVDQVIAKMNITAIKEINPKLKAQLKFPFNIQLYYQLNAEDPNFNYYTNLSFYELISRFIQEKIYHSTYYTEKMLFLKKVIQLTDYGKNGNSVVKNQLISELSAFRSAYIELLTDGILMEERRFENSHPQEFVRFVHSHIFEYFLFIEILEKFNLCVDLKFFQYIKKEYDNNQVYFILLQWVIRFLVKIGDLSTLTSIFSLGLNDHEKSYLILFIAENLEHRSNYDPDTSILLKEHHFHDAMIKELISFDFIDPCYTEGISALLKTADTDENILLYHAILALPDIFSLDQDKIRQRLSALGRYRHLSAQWTIDPLAITNLIFKKIIDAPVEPYEALARINPILQATHQNESSTLPLQTRTAVGYLFAFSLNLFYGNQKQVIELVQAITKLHPNLFYSRSQFAIYLLNLLGIAGAKIDPCKKTDQVERIISKISTNNTHHVMTKSSRSLFLMFSAEQSRNRQEYKTAIERTEECIFIFKKNAMNLNCLFAYNLMIEIYTLLKDAAKINEYKYERLCFLEERNIPAHLFSLPKVTT